MPRNKEFDYDEKLIAARNLFWKKGYHATSMNDLVDAMEINRSSIYLTYGNKQDLFLKSLGHYIQQKNKQYRLAAEKSDDPLTAVKHIIDSVFESALKDNNCLFTNSIFELAANDTETGKILKEQTLQAVDLFEHLLKKAKANGTLTSNKNPRALAQFLVSGLTSIYSTHLVFSDKKLTRQTATLLIESVIH